MFYFTYLRRELKRRARRTIVTVTGLAVGVALVVAITAVSGGLDDAQGEVLDPLASVGSDLVVTRPVESNNAQGGQAQDGAGQAGPGFGLRGGALADPDQRALVAESASVLTDLSKLGAPGEKFVHDFFLPATQLTFSSDNAGVVADLPGVSAVAQGLTLVAQHQEGTVPEIVAEFQTGGEEITVDQQITPPTPEEEAQIRQCLQDQGVVPPADGGVPGAPPNVVVPVPADPGGGEIREGGGFGGVLANCLPERLRRFRSTITTPQRAIQQIINPPQTDITTDTYTIAGVDPSAPDLGLITAAQITEGRILSSEAAEPEAVLAEAYAQRKGIALDSMLVINDQQFKVVGFSQPPLGGQAADVYLALGDLQAMSSRDGRVSVLLVRAESAADVSGLRSAIEEAFPGATVTSAEQVANRISGSLVDAAKLSERLGSVLAVVVLIAAFAVAVLLTLSSVSKRVRELGTLKAIGWRQSQVVRQVMAESAVQGALGGVLGVGLGIAAAALAAGFAPELVAEAPGVATSALFGLGDAAPASTTIPLSAPVDPALLITAMGLAVLGGVLAGAAGGLRAARLRPVDALRELG